VLDGGVSKADPISAADDVIAEAIPLTMRGPAVIPATVNRRQQQEARFVRRYAVYLLLLLRVVVLVVAGVVGGVCGSTGKCSSSDSSTDGATSSSPTPAPISDRAAAIAAYINNITLTTNKTIAYPPVNETGLVDAAEEQALQWLIESDPLTLTAASSDQFRLQQRSQRSGFKRRAMVMFGRTPRVG
jgi:hypothetical protein